jgi:lantibiotic modifying enzyme
VAGVGVFLADYYRLTGDPQAKYLVQQAIRWCTAPDRVIAGEAQALGDSLGRGRAGIGIALLRYARATGAPRRW